MKVYCVFIIFTAFALIEIVAQNIQNKILNYFKDDIVRSFVEQWQKYKIPMENAVLMALKEIYGHKGMNVYIRKMRDPHKINKGYYHSDNQVQIVLSDLELDNLPHIWMPQVTFPLPSNVLRVVASLSKMIVRCNYMVFRNLTNIIYDSKDQNYFKNSPFTYQQTKTVGQLGIIIEGCVLSGFTVATLNGPSVNLGHDTFNIYNCHHTFEIYNSGTQAPPVFASYYPEGEGLNIEQLLMVSLREELMPKLQAAMFSYVNTTAIFGDNLPVFRDKQEDIFRQTANYMSDLTRNMNKLTAEKNIATISMDDFKITWDDLFPECLLQEVNLNKMFLTGLDTAYSSHTGGPISEPITCVSEEIRFERLQVYGIVDFKGGKHAAHNFSAEIKDTVVPLTMELDGFRMAKRKQENLPLKSIKAFEVTGWRSFEFSASGDENISIEALVTGYLLKVLPKYIIEHLGRVYKESIKKTNGQLHERESMELNKAEENNTEELKESKGDAIDSQDIQGEQNGEELDERENEEQLSVSAQNESKQISHENEFQNETIEVDKTQEKEEESNIDLDNSVIETEGLEDIDKENSTTLSIEHVNIPSEQEILNSEIKSDNASSGEVHAGDIDRDRSSNETKENMSEFENKTVINASNQIAPSDSKNISLGDSTHLSDNEIRSDF